MGEGVDTYNDVLVYSKQKKWCFGSWGTSFEEIGQFYHWFLHQKNCFWIRMFQQSQKP